MELNKEDLEKVHKILLYIAKEIKRICEENQIQYSIFGGSLIGAIRHNGFIPWDDDMDIVMTRANYDKFLSCCEEQLGEEFEILNWNTNCCFGNGFTKVVLKNTIAIENKNVKYPQNFFIDVFPIDKTSDIAICRRVQWTCGRIFLRALQIKEGSVLKPCSQFDFIYLLICSILSRLFSHEFLVKSCEYEMKKYDNKKSHYIVSLAGFYNRKKEIFEAKYVKEYITLPFENTQFMAFKDYDQILRHYYGDYMKLPPVKERRTHGFLKVDFGEYFDNKD